MFILDYSGEEDNATHNLVDAVHRNSAIDLPHK